MSPSWIPGRQRLDAALGGITTAFLFIAPFPGSAGLRATLLILAVGVLLALHARGMAFDLAALPRTVVALFAAWALLATASVAWSAQPAYTLQELRAEVLYGALAFATFLFAARERSRWWAWRHALLLGSFVVIGVHLLQPLLPFTLTRHSIEGQSGLWSTYLVLVAPVLLTVTWPPPWGDARSGALQLAALLLLFGAAWVTGNRAVWLALGVELAVAMALSGHVETVDRARLRAFRIAVLAAVLMVAVALVGTIKDRIALSASPGASLTAGLANDVRPKIWAVAWEQFQQAPWFGHGFGREILAPEFVKVTPAVHNHPEIQHAHNIFIDMALQLGVVGLAAFVAVLAALALRYRACLRDSRIAPLGILGLTLLAGFVVKNMTDDFLHRHNALVFWALNGILLGLAAGPARLSPAGPSPR